MPHDNILCAGFFFLVFYSIPSSAGESAEDAIWRFEKAISYENPSSVIPRPISNNLEIIGGKFRISSQCDVVFSKKEYRADAVFQLFIKSGDSLGEVYKFMQDQLGLRQLEKMKYYYQLDSEKCNDIGAIFLVSQNRLVAIRASSIFYLFSKQSEHFGKQGGSYFLNDSEFEASALPFNVQNFFRNCLPKVVKGVPTRSDKCARKVYSYVASHESRDSMSKVVGLHDYKGGGADGADDDYIGPIKHGLHPVFIVFPPKGDITIVRVEDLEGRNESRERMAGVYLAIKNGRVAYQLNMGCELSDGYICVSRSGEKYELLSNGKFIRTQ